METNMKSQSIKKIVVKCADFWTDEFEIDSEVFDDVYAEAATRSVERRKDLPGFKVTVVIECWEKKDLKNPEKHFCYNTYRILINAGLHEKAEIFRNNFMKASNIDLQKENLKGEDENDRRIITTNNTANSGSLGI